MAGRRRRERAPNTLRGAQEFGPGMPRLRGTAPAGPSRPAVVTPVQGRVLVGVLPAMKEEGQEPEPDEQSEDDFAFTEAGRQKRGREPLPKGNGRIQHG